MAFGLTKIHKRVSHKIILYDRLLTETLPTFLAPHMFILIRFVCFVFSERVEKMFNDTGQPKDAALSQGGVLSFTTPEYIN